MLPASTPGISVSPCFCGTIADYNQTLNLINQVVPW